MSKKTLYVAANDETLWAAVERVAEKSGTSVTRIVVEALKNDLPRAAAALDEKPVDEWAHIAADAA